MNDIKVGEYIRLDDGAIRKVIKRDEDNHIITDIYWEAQRWLTEFDEKKRIKSHSPNIIDLIEVGDYVNGYKADEIRNNYIVFCDDFRKEYKEYEIKDIVTHEQFNSIKYVLGGKE